MARYMLPPQPKQLGFDALADFEGAPDYVVVFDGGSEGNPGFGYGSYAVITRDGRRLLWLRASDPVRAEAPLHAPGQAPFGESGGKRMRVLTATLLLIALATGSCRTADGQDLLDNKVVPLVERLTLLLVGQAEESR